MASMNQVTTWIHLIKQLVAWGWRCAVLLWAFNVLVPPSARAVMGEPQSVVTLHDHVCIHTRLIDEVHEWKMLRSLELVREMGATTIVEFFPWAYFEPSKDRYDWSRADLILKFAQNQGLQVIARLGLVPNWAREGESSYSTLNTLPEEAYDDFAEFAADFATRYEGIVTEIIVWNEPNLAFEWGFRGVDPAAYVELVKTVYQAVRAAAPSVLVLAGALAPTLEPVGSANGLNDLLYLQAMYDAGVQPYFDGLAIHTYGFSQSASEPPDPQTLNFRRAELLYQIMMENGDGDKPVFITESGWNDHPRWAYGVRPSQRVEYTIKAFDVAETSWSWARTVCNWVFRYPTPTNSYPDNFTIAGTNFELKPLYYAIRDYTQQQTTREDLWLPAPQPSSP